MGHVLGDSGFFQYWKSPADSAWDFCQLSSKTNSKLPSISKPTMRQTSSKILPSEITFRILWRWCFSRILPRGSSPFFSPPLGIIFFWKLCSKHRVQSRIPRFFRIFPMKSRSHFSRGNFLIFCAEVLKVICPSSRNWLKPRCSWACGMRFV